MVTAMMVCFRGNDTIHIISILRHKDISKLIVFLLSSNLFITNNTTWLNNEAEKFFLPFTCKKKRKTSMKVVEAFTKSFEVPDSILKPIFLDFFNFKRSFRPFSIFGYTTKMIEPIKTNLNTFTTQWCPRRDIRNIPLFKMNLNH